MKKHHRMGQTGVVLLLTGLLILLCTWLVVAVAMRNRESFADTIFSAAELKSFKSDAYNSAGIKGFYSDGRLDSNYVFFNPSMNDIVCKLGSKELSESGCEPNKNAIDAISCNDNMLALYPRVACPQQYMPSPAESYDCSVRILDGIYKFSKKCITINIKVSHEARNPKEFFVRFGDYGTIVMMLLRPIFMRGGHCRLVAPDVVDPNQSKMVLDMQRDDMTPNRYRTRLVTEPIVVASDDASLDIPTVGAYIERIFRNRRRPSVIEQAQVNSGTFSYRVKINESSFDDVGDLSAPMWVPVPITMYYMTFVEHVDLAVRNANEPVPLFVVTLYIPTTDAPERLFRMDNPLLSLSWENRNGSGQRLIINTSRGQQIIDAPPGGHVVLTYTTTLLIAVYMSSSRYHMVEIGKMANLAASDRTGILAYAADRHPPPVAAYPYKNGCIPNFADLAIKLGYLNP